MPWQIPPWWIRILVKWFCTIIMEFEFWLTSYLSRWYTTLEKFVWNCGVLMFSWNLLSPLAYKNASQFHRADFAILQGPRSSWFPGIWMESLYPSGRNKNQRKQKNTSLKGSLSFAMSICFMFHVPSRGNKKNDLGWRKTKSKHFMWSHFSEFDSRTSKFPDDSWHNFHWLNFAPVWKVHPQLGKFTQTYPTKNSRRFLVSEKKTYDGFPWDEGYIYPTWMADFDGFHVGKCTGLLPWIRHGGRNVCFRTVIIFET